MSSSSSSFQNLYIPSSDSEDNECILPEYDRSKMHRLQSKAFSLADFSENSMRKIDEYYRQLREPKMRCLAYQRLSVAIKNKNKEAIRTAAFNLFMENKNDACGKNSYSPNSRTEDAKLEESQEYQKKLEELERFPSEVTSSDSNADISENRRLSERIDIDDTLSEKISRLCLSNLTAFTESFRIAPTCSSTNRYTVMSNVANKFNHFAVNDVDPVPDSVHSNPTSSAHSEEILDEVPSAETSPDDPENADIDYIFPRRCLSLLSNLSPLIEGFRFAQDATVPSVRKGFDDSLCDFKFEEFDPMKEFPVINEEFRLQGVRIFEASDSDIEDLSESIEPQKRKSAEVNPLAKRHCTCHGIFNKSESCEINCVSSEIKSIQYSIKQPLDELFAETQVNKSESRENNCVSSEIQSIQYSIKQPLDELFAETEVNNSESDDSCNSDSSLIKSIEYFMKQVADALFAETEVNKSESCENNCVSSEIQSIQYSIKQPLDELFAETEVNKSESHDSCNCDVCLYIQTSARQPIHKILAKVEAKKRKEKKKKAASVYRFRRLTTVVKKNKTLRLYKTIR